MITPLEKASLIQLFCQIFHHAVMIQMP